MIIQKSLRQIYKLIIISYLLLWISIKLVTNKKRFIIVSDQYGRLGNRLHLFAQLIVFAKKENFELFFPGFFDYIKYFGHFKYLASYGNNYTGIPSFIAEDLLFFSFNSLTKIFRLIPFDKIQVFSFFKESDGNPWEKITHSEAKCIFFNGFVFLDYMLDFDSTENLIQSIFQPHNKFTSEINRPFLNFKKTDNSVICGVLIRQTDYRDWNNGKYFFETHIYVKYMKHICTLFTDKDIYFFIASDEVQDQSQFSEFDFFLRVGYPLENMYSLSKCDILMGPPSSYIGWSSIYSKLPLYSIIDRNCNKSSFNSFINKIEQRNNSLFS